MSITSVRNLNRLIQVSLFIALLITSCIPNFKSQNPSIVDIDFEVITPVSTNLNNELFIEILDEVTGLGINPIRHRMNAIDESNFSITLPFMVNAVIKYRFIRGGNPPFVEYDSQGEQIRYRLFHVKSAGKIKDQIAGWQDYPFLNPTGTLQGFVYDESTSQPISNVMVIIAGMRTFTGEDGSYSISGIPIGEHLLTAYHVDCLYENFQQGAVIAENAITPANFGMKSSPLVDITFATTPPTEHIAGAPVYLIGNLFSVGNTFMDLKGGLSTSTDRSPVLNYQSDGTYKITLSLPTSCYFEYKYSLGDGFWNAEHGVDGKWNLRKIIIPSHTTTIYDKIASWKDNDSNPISISVTTPLETPINGIVYLQINPFVWMEPIRTWKIGNNQWLYTIYSPLNLVNNSTFRFLLNDGLSIRYDVAAQGENTTGILFSNFETSVDYSISEWVPK